jgi:heterotetrameric sarcosine oxidase delta subunit
MRIPCPFCGVRDASEFTYLGDASLKRPDPSSPSAERAFYEYVYLRDNPAGPHREFWHHVSGCRSWLIVTRDTRNHEILGAEFAAP